MCTKTDDIDWNGRKLEGVVHVLEALEAPLVDQPLSPTLFELRLLLESIRKVLQVSVSVGSVLLTFRVLRFSGNVAPKAFHFGNGAVDLNVLYSQVMRRFHSCKYSECGTITCYAYLA